MASVQQQVGGESQQLDDKQKAAIEEVVQEAQSALENDINDAKARQPQLALVAGATRNDLQHRGLFLNKSHNYTGHFVVKPPQTIGARATGIFLHQGAFTHHNLQVIVGSKAYVIYGTFDKALPHLGYLLAWSKPANGSNDIDKVYVLAGEFSTLIKLTDAEIEQKLDASRGESHSYDPKTGARADAIIRDITPSGNLALLGARFYQHLLN